MTVVTVVTGGIEATATFSDPLSFRQPPQILADRSLVEAQRVGYFFFGCNAVGGLIDVGEYFKAHIPSPFTFAGLCCSSGSGFEVGARRAPSGQNQTGSHTRLRSHPGR